MVLVSNSERVGRSCSQRYCEYRGCPPYLWILCHSLRWFVPYYEADTRVQPTQDARCLDVLSPYIYQVYGCYYSSSSKPTGTLCLKLYEDRRT